MRDVVGGGLREWRDEKARGGERLRAAREREGFSQEGLAGKAGVSRSVVAFAESGSSLPQPRNRRKLADASSVDLWG